MKYIQQFIEDSRERGYETVPPLIMVEVGIDCIFLDPKAWQAVYKFNCKHSEEMECLKCVEWKEKWHLFIDQLADGKTVEQALKHLATE